MAEYVPGMIVASVQPLKGNYDLILCWSWKIW